MTQKLLAAAVEDIILQYTYPRLDAEVSKHRNHLLKAPFCVHPKTGRVCVPVDPDNIDEFDPERVPTVNQLLKELDATIADVSMDGEVSEHHSGMSKPRDTFRVRYSRDVIDWERTSLKPYVEMMDRHALALMEEVRRSKRGGGTGERWFMKPSITAC